MKRTVMISLAAVAAMGFLFVACAKNETTGRAGDGSPVLATVNGETVTTNEFKAEADSLSPYAGQIYADEEARNKLLDNLISKKLLIQAARKKGYENDPEIVRRMNEVRDNLLLGYYVKREIFDKSDVTDQEIKDYFDKNKDKLGKARISHIQVGSQEEAEEVLVKYKAGESFRSLARKYSKDDKTRNSGGDLGFLDWTKFGSPDLRDAAFNTPLGEVGNIVKSSFAYHVIKVTDRKPAKDEDFERIKDDLRDYLIEKRKQDFFEAKVKSLKDGADISKNDLAIKELASMGQALTPLPSGRQ